MTSLDLTTSSLRQARESLDSKQISSVELAQFFVNRIKQFDPQLNSVITETADLALEQAEHADRRIANGDSSALLGGFPDKQRHLLHEGCENHMRLENAR